MPKVIMIGGIWEGGSLNRYSTSHQMDRSSRPSPTTTMPMTVPAEKATRSPPFRLCLAAQAVRALARVATLMPMKPASPENTPPVRKAKGTKRLIRFRTKESTMNRANSSTKMMPTTLYCCRR